MNLRKLLPRRITPRDHHRAIFRAGVAEILDGIVTITSLGRMSTDWKILALELPETEWALRRFFELLSVHKPYTRWVGARAPRRVRMEGLAQALAGIATGTVEALSCGYVSAEWSMMWAIYGEEILDKIEERLKAP